MLTGASCTIISIRMALKYPKTCFRAALKFAGTLAFLLVLLCTNARASSAGHIISYHLNRPGNVSLAVYNGKHVMVRELLHGLAQPAGDHTVAWDGLLRDGTAAPAGNYTWKLLQTQGLSSQFIMNAGTNYPLGNDLSSSGGPVRMARLSTVATDDTGIYISAFVTENLETCMVKLSTDGSKRLWSQRLPYGPDGQPMAWGRSLEYRRSKQRGLSA